MYNIQQDNSALSTQHPALVASLGDKMARRWVDFGRLLRRNGVMATAGQMRDLLAALPLLDLRDRESVYFASRALLCSRKEDLPKFDLVFRQFWGRTRQIIIPSDTGSIPTEGTPTDSSDTPGEEDPSNGQQGALPTFERAVLAESEDEGGSPVAAEGDIERALLYSSQERLKQLDFARFTDEELAAARAIMAGWKWEPGLRRTRRLTPARRGRRLDVSRTLRGAMKTEGVPFSLETRGPRQKPRPLVLLCDISGSMAPYTRMLLHFMHTVRREVGHAEVFLFGTRLTRVTRQLKSRDVDHALEEVSKRVVDWSGGTRIGEALRTFNTQWARRVLGQGAIVCIISDGWDRGDPTLLTAEIAHLQRTSFRLIWLNPLLGIRGYQPLTRGMKAAIPFVDNFLPANNLASLQALAALLARLDVNARPDRRQAPLPEGGPSEVADAPRFAVKVGVSER
jgi:uncharacterized protein with von Willebrand factor type A (vWA) domain